MKGFPKRIATGKDLLNYLALVQAGELPAAPLEEAISAIEEREYISLPIVELSDDRKTVVVQACAELAEGAKVKTAAATATVKGVAEKAASLELEPGGSIGGGKTPVLEDDKGSVEVSPDSMKEAALASVTLSSALPEGAKVLRVLSPVDPYEVLHTTKGEVSAIKEVLKNYE